MSTILHYLTDIANDLYQSGCKKEAKKVAVMYDKIASKLPDEKDVDEALDEGKEVDKKLHRKLKRHIDKVKKRTKQILEESDE
jgi:DNA-binding transcriptional regulator GbsR (MarR family)